MASIVQLGTPPVIPPQFNTLCNQPVEDIRARLKLLHHFSDLIYSSWRLLPLGQQREPAMLGSMAQAVFLGRLRNLLAPRVYTLPLVRSIGRTMVQGKNYGPQITVKRLATRGKKCKPIFVQIARQVVKLKPVDLRLPARAWKVITFNYLINCRFSLNYVYIICIRNKFITYFRSAIDIFG